MLLPFLYSRRNCNGSNFALDDDCVSSGGTKFDSFFLPGNRRLPYFCSFCPYQTYAADFTTNTHAAAAAAVIITLLLLTTFTCITHRSIYTIICGSANDGGTLRTKSVSVSSSRK